MASGRLVKISTLKINLMSTLKLNPNIDIRKQFSRILNKLHYHDFESFVCKLYYRKGCTKTVL